MEKIPDWFKGEKAIVLPYSIRTFQASNMLTENLYVTHIGYYPHAKLHFRNRKIGAPEYIIIYCEEGKGWVQVGDDKFNLSKKNALIILAATPHVCAGNKN